MCILGVMYIIRFLFRKRSTFWAFCSGIGPVCQTEFRDRAGKRNKTGPVSIMEIIVLAVKLSR